MQKQLLTLTLENTWKKAPKCFEGWSLVTKRTEIHSIFRGADEIKGMPISKDFRIEKDLVVTPV